MDIDDDDREFPDHPIFSRVLGMFDGNPGFQRILRLGLQAELDANEDIYVMKECTQLPFEPDEYLKASNWKDGKYTGKFTIPANAVRVPYFTSTAEQSQSACANPRSKASDARERVASLQEGKNYASKAERKRLKKQKQREKKQLEKLEKEQPNSAANKDGNDATQTERSKLHNESKHSSNSSDQWQQASAKDTDDSGSSDGYSDEDGDVEDVRETFEELDLTSSFVSKAAEIARRKLEQKPKSENKEKKKSPVKGEVRKSPEKEEAGKKDLIPSCSLTFEDNVRKSTDLANTGNKFASTGDFDMAVKYFTDAIRYNPTEFKLFGNRSLCFEKMQEYEKALTDADLSLSMCPGWVKGLFRKGRALAGLKRYDEASHAYREVLRLDPSCAEAAQELRRMQITQLMGYGFSQEQSSSALIIHGTVEKALKVLSKLNNKPGPAKTSALPTAQASPVLTAADPASALHLHQSQNAPKALPKNTPLVPVQNTEYVQSQPKPVPDQAPRTYDKDPGTPQELFPVWVGNLFSPVSEAELKRLFNRAGVVHNVKILSYKRCAFVNFTKQEYCDEAIRRYNGFDLNGANIVVRYPDRIPHGMGLSRSALKAQDLHDENTGYNYGDGRFAGRGRRPFQPFRPGPDYRGHYKY